MFILNHSYLMCNIHKLENFLITYNLIKKKKRQKKIYCFLEIK